jgi:hypothetical protein
MNCRLCNTETLTKTQDILSGNRLAGNAIVPLVEVEECSACGEIALSTKAENEMAAYLKMRQKKVMAGLPVDDLISAGQAAEILGVTKQAFSKNPKIKKGFVYFTQVGAKKNYFKTSVELFKATGDGRFPMTKWSSSVPSDQISKFNPHSTAWQKITKTDGAEDADHEWNTSQQQAER